MGLVSREERLGAIKSLKPVYPKHVGLPDQLIQLMVAFSILYFTGNSLSLSFQASGQLRTPAGLGPDNSGEPKRLETKARLNIVLSKSQTVAREWCVSASTRIGKVPWNWMQLVHVKGCE